ncbi:hypothetical protein [Streptomyces sp. NPDC000851]
MTEQTHATEEQPVVIPPLPEAPPAVPTAEAPAEAPAEPPAEPPAKKDRRALRAVLRWTAAVVVFATVGAATAYGITRLERTDVPGLATESDGRWPYPEITRPPLPSGSPEPFADVNTAGIHHADLRELLLPAPKGAKADQSLRGADGWLATKEFLGEFESKEDREDFGQDLTDHGLRHIAARGWTTEDGTHTRIYLLRFNTAAVVDELFSGELTQFAGPGYTVRGADATVYDEEFPEKARSDDVQQSVYVEAKPYGDEQVRQAYLSAGDVLAVILQSREGTAAAVPFQQTVVLQSQLLG